MERGVEAETVQPAEFGDAPFAGAGRLNPTEGLGPPAAVVRHKEDVPPPKSHNCADNVDDKKASHGVFAYSSDADGTSEVADRQGGKGLQRGIFSEDGGAGLWKKWIMEKERRAASVLVEAEGRYESERFIGSRLQ